MGMHRCIPGCSAGWVAGQCLAISVAAAMPDPSVMADPHNGSPIGAREQLQHGSGAPRLLCSRGQGGGCVAVLNYSQPCPAVLLLNNFKALEMGNMKFHLPDT